MNDWNGNGKYDVADSYIDYRLATSSSTSGVSSDWWLPVVLYLLSAVFPPLGVILLIIAFIAK